MDAAALKRDLAALLLLAGVIFLGVALATYSPADPLPQLPAGLDQVYQQDLLVYPQHDRIMNACGRWGALAADLMYRLLGAGAIYFVVSLAALDVALLRRWQANLPLLRTLGWCLSLWGLTTMLQLATPHWTIGAFLGCGGQLGYLGRSVLEQHFAQAGALIIAGSLMIAGLLLSTDYVVFRAAFSLLLWVAGCGAMLVRWRWARSDATPAAGSKRKTKGAAVKIRGKQLSDLDAVDAEYEDEEEEPAASSEEVEEEEEEDESAKLPVKTPGKAAGKKGEEEVNFKVRNPLDKRKEAADKARDEVISHLNDDNYQGDNEYELPSLDLLLQSEDIDYEAQTKEVRRKAKILEKTFLDFGFTVKVVEIETGPVIAQYEVELEAGLRLSKITSLADDLAIALRVPSVRIVAPIPGKNTVGIEVPNEQRQIVRLRESIEEANSKVKKMRIPLFLGKDVSGNSLVADLSALPHLLIAGRTGTGKSVCLNAIITSILMTRRPDEVRMLMIDPKMVELSGYGKLPHLMHPVVTDMRKAEAILAWAVEKMEERYALLARAGVRHISSYNQLGEEELMDRLQPENDEERDSIPRQLPFIVIVADEIADLMMTSGKEVEQHIIRLAQKSRAVGIHLILATQKPTVDVITGLIKSNLPARIAFQVASRTDSRVVLDEMGADKLLGNGDMLFLWPGTSTLLRGQGTYLSDEEINAVCAQCSRGEQHFVQELINMKVKTPEGEEKSVAGLKKRDDLYEAAVDLVVREGRGSVSLLQRSLGIGYGRAARLIDYMAEDNIVGQYNGSQAREVAITLEQWEAMQAAGAEAEAPAVAKAAPKKRTNKVAMEVEDQPRALPAPKPRTIKPVVETIVDEEEEDLWEESSNDSENELDDEGGDDAQEFEEELEAENA